jgi:EAL domain-containing protein (putative c-di-GMP-specific phosphodiesterase class I)
MVAHHHDIKIQSLIAHLRQNEVGSAIDDAGYPLNAISR